MSQAQHICVSDLFIWLKIDSVKPLEFHQKLYAKPLRFPELMKPSIYHGIALLHAQPNFGNVQYMKVDPKLCLCLLHSITTRQNGAARPVQIASLSESSSGLITSCSCRSATLCGRRRNHRDFSLSERLRQSWASNHLLLDWSTATRSLTRVTADTNVRRGDFQLISPKPEKKKKIHQLPPSGYVSTTEIVWLLSSPMTLKDTSAPYRDKRHRSFTRRV